MSTPPHRPQGRRRSRRLPPCRAVARSQRSWRRSTWSSRSTMRLTLFGDDVAGEAPAVSLPRAWPELVGIVVCHRDPERYALLYRLVWRVLNGERDLLEVASDPLVHRLDLMARSVRRDLHKMHAFVRFRRMRAGRPGALRRLVRAGAFHPGSGGAVLRRPLPLARLDDPDPDRLRALGPRGAEPSARPARREDAPDGTASRRAGAATTRACSTRRG